MSINLHDAPPTALEALRPNDLCSVSTYLRFLNFTDALDRWYRALYTYEHSGPQPVHTNHPSEIFLRENTWALFQRYYVYIESAPKGKHWHPDRSFMRLFPETFPPLFDGTRFTWSTLTEKILKVLGHPLGA
jgi:hypothetical protein